MSFATFESELLNSPVHKETSRQSEVRGTGRSAGMSIQEALGVLSYNQGLVEFADSKAGSLILLNSLLIAAVAALPNQGGLGVYKLASVLLCSAAVYVCFQVISSKDESSKDPKYGKCRSSFQGWEQSDFLFFGCIGKFKNGDEFCRAVNTSDHESRKQALLQRTYIIACIAQRKFAQYKTAQQMTSVALLVWVGVNLIPFLRP